MESIVVPRNKNASDHHRATRDNLTGIESEAECASDGSPGAGTEPLQVLALDGGGLRGIFTAATLAAWEEDFPVSIADHFDLIVGTSTGGIIAIALGLGMSPAKILSIYLNHSDRIFPARNRTPPWAWRRLLRTRYDPVELKAVLQENFGTQRLGNSKVRLAIPSYDLTADQVHLFRTPHHQDLRRDWRVPAVEVALATAAAPTFLPAHQMKGQRLIDGGVWANNPTLVGVAECFGRLGGARGRIRVLNVGATNEIRKRKATLDEGSSFAWLSDSFDVMLRGQCLAATNYAQLILGRSNVVRANAPTTGDLHKLDSVTAPDLIGLARSESRTLSPSLDSFFQHNPYPYTPCYQ